MLRLLLVEDECSLADTLAAGLRRQGFAVDVAADVDDAQFQLDVTPYDIVVLDRGLSGKSGDQIAVTLAERVMRPRILMLSAAGDVRDRIHGLNLGADDYLVKPFAFDELVARIHALGRRPATARPTVVRHKNIELHPATLAVRRGGRHIELRNKEFAVLYALVTAEGRFLSAERLLERVWDHNADPFTHTVKATIANLRRKLGPPNVIENVRGIGYRLRANEPGED